MAPMKSRSCWCPRETSSAATATSMPSFTRCAGASPAPRRAGALQRHRHTLQSPDVGDHYGPGVRPPIMASGLGAQLIRTSGSEAGWDQKLSRLPVSLRAGLLPFLLSFHTATRTPLHQYAHLHARLPVCLRGGLLACVPSTHACLHRHTGRVAARIFFWYIFCRFTS